ncbi:hypothetical protein PG985_008353 [Apiospora marii]|uniref:Uncharacterized protein n=1 Tax=Apiospora marii TaxID=335849 RepID=A0ABR1SRQ2_9PEZI
MFNGCNAELSGGNCGLFPEAHLSTTFPENFNAQYRPHPPPEPEPPTPHPSGPKGNRNASAD